MIEVSLGSGVRHAIPALGLNCLQYGRRNALALRTLVSIHLPIRYFIRTRHTPSQLRHPHLSPAWLNWTEAVMQSATQPELSVMPEPVDSTIEVACCAVTALVAVAVVLASAGALAFL